MLRRAPSASDSTLSFENLAELRSKHHGERTQDLSLSDLVPANPPEPKQRRKLWPAALALGALLALGGLGWFASSKARVSDAPSPAEQAAYAVDSAPKRLDHQEPRSAAPQAAAASAPSGEAPPAAPADVRAAEPAAAPEPAAPQVDNAVHAGAAAVPEPATAAPDAAAQARAAALVGKAQALHKRRKFAPAKARYREALKVSPDYAPALVGLTQVAIRLRDGKLAVQTAKQLVSAQPDDTSHQVLLGDALKLAGQRKEAKEVWRSAARKGSAEARARLRR